MKKQHIIITVILLVIAWYVASLLLIKNDVKAEPTIDQLCQSWSIDACISIDKRNKQLYIELANKTKGDSWV